MLEHGVYLGLFGISFLAATVLPAQSEIGLVGLILSENYSITLLIIVASVGNTLGAVVNWVIGLYVNQLKHNKAQAIGQSDRVVSQVWSVESFDELGTIRR